MRLKYRRRGRESNPLPLLHLDYSVYFLMALRLRRLLVPIPAKPVPSKSSVAGSGVGVATVILDWAESVTKSVLFASW